MARTPSPQKLHRAKDLCTIEQAEYIANLVAAHHVERYVARLKHHAWHRRLWRWLTRR